MTGAKVRSQRLQTTEEKTPTKTKLQNLKLSQVYSQIVSKNGPDPETIRMEQRFNELVRKDKKKIKNQTSESVDC